MTPVDSVAYDTIEFHGHCWYGPEASWDMLWECPGQCGPGHEKYLLHQIAEGFPDECNALAMFGPSQSRAMPNDPRPFATRALFLALVVTTVRTVFRGVVDWRVESFEAGNVLVRGLLRPGWARPEWVTNEPPDETLMEFVDVQTTTSEGLQAGDILVQTWTDANQFEPIMQYSGYNVSQFAPECVFGKMRTTRKSPVGGRPAYAGQIVCTRSAGGIFPDMPPAATSSHVIRNEQVSHAYKCWRTVMYIHDVFREYIPPRPKGIHGRREEPCTVCGEMLRGKQIKECVQCLLRVYCSKECQRHDWQSTHRSQCKDIAESQWRTLKGLWEYGGSSAGRQRARGWYQRQCSVEASTREGLRLIFARQGRPVPAGLQVTFMQNPAVIVHPPDDESQVSHVDILD